MLELSSENARRQRSWAARLKDGLTKTRSRLSGLFGGGAIDPMLFETLESALLASDVGVDATRFLLAGLRERARGLQTAGQLKAELRAMLVETLTPLEQTLDFTGKKPCIIVLAGVNGSGKTTSIGKLARYFQNQGLSVLLAAGDTFRAAAREQLAVWGEKNADVVIADTAGRLPTQLHLMEEISRIKRVIAKAEPGAPHEAWLVLDANTGQNALNQVKAFDDALGLTGLILTKFDGSAKGGVVCAIALARSQRPLPLRFVGIGEGIDDLRPFAADEFVSALLDGPPAWPS